MRFICLLYIFVSVTCHDLGLVSGSRVRKSSGTVIVNILWEEGEGDALEPRPCYNPYTSYDPHLRYWTQPNPL
jgi:hypothetical protein